MLLHKKIGLRQRDLMQESVNELEIGGIVRPVSYTHLDVYKRQKLYYIINFALRKTQTN